MLRPPDLDPRSVRRQFSRRAARFAGVDFLYREIEQRMFDRLELIRLAPQRILDVGCGLGAGLGALAQRYPSARLLGIDAADGMLRHNAFAPAPQAATLSKRLRGWAGRLMGTPADAARVDLVAADAARLPVGDHQAGLLWSNLAWHWFDDPPAVAAEWHRVLEPGGLLMFSAFGVDTLRELRGLGAQLPELPDLHDVGDLLGQTAFVDPVMDTERLTISYADPQRLLAEWHGMGGNASRQRLRGLCTPRRRQRWIEAIESLRGADGRIAVSVEIVHAHAWRGEPTVESDGYQAIRWMPRTAPPRVRHGGARP
ncbi:MAG: methyltransferase domain-containing protein [Burkholderiaceae bacterium]